jgi:hypothetical protein
LKADTVSVSWLPHSFVTLAVAFAALGWSRPAAASPPAIETAASPALPAPDGADGPPPAVYGLYPLWEHTGAVDAHGAARVGLRRAQVTLWRLTLATDPYLDLYGTLNAGLKVGIVREGRLRLAVQVDTYRVPTAAETRGIGNLHAGAFSNPYSPMSLLPVSAAVTWLVGPALHVHASATWLPTLSETASQQTSTAGVTTWVEWFASSSYSARLHAGAEGWPAATQEHVGFSLGYRSKHVALQGGYARRFAPEGTSAHTVMFDGALLFP